mgnify:CR=1 FL=1
MKVENRSQRQGVRISAWKLAKLDRDEATRAAAKARERSSVLRPLRANGSSFRDTDGATSMSSKSSFGGLKDSREMTSSLANRPSHYYSFTGVDNRSDATQSTYSSPSRGSINGSGGVSPFPPPQTRGGGVNAPHLVSGSQPPQIQRYPFVPQSGFRQGFPNFYVTNAASIDSSSDRHMPLSEDSFAQTRAGRMNRYMRGNKRESVFWSGNGKDGPSSSSIINRHEFRSGEQPSGVSNMRVPVDESLETRIPFNGTTDVDEPNIRVSRDGGVVTPSENLMYNGTSIFFGGPLYTPFTNKRENPQSLQGQYLKPL